MIEGFFSKQDTESLRTSGGPSSSCFSCGLFKGVQSPKMEPYGNFKKRIMIIGEAPGEKEDRVGKPWQGKTGRLLQRTLADLGIDLFEDCLSLNAVNCRTPESRPPTKKEIDCCRQVKVLKAITENKPVMVILLGGEALSSVLGLRWKSSALGGITKWAGRCIPDQYYKCWICPTYHPSYVEKAASQEVSVVWENDIKRFIEHLDTPFLEYREPNIHYIEDLTELDSLVTSNLAAFDYETTGLKPHAPGHRVVCASIAYDWDNVVTFRMPKKKSEREPFIRFLQSKIRKVAQNLKFEDGWTNNRLGTAVRNWYHDTMLCSHTLDHRPGTTGLKFQTYVTFGVVGYDEEVGPFLRSKDNKSNSINRIQELLDRPGGERLLLKYCALDSTFELRLAMLQFPQVEEFAESYRLLHLGIQAFARAERQGMRVDINLANASYEKLTQVIEELTAKFKKTKFYSHWLHSRGKSSLNIDSNFQLESFLYKVKKLKPTKQSASGKGAVDEEALRGLNIPELDDLLRLRKLKKLRDTYLNAFITESVDGFMHPVFNLHTVSTYRSSSDSPNFQNIPIRDEEAKKVVRTCLFARVGHQLMEVDYSSIEVGIAACYHKDPTMMEYIKDPTTDMHSDMAKQIFFLEEVDKKVPALKLLRNAAKNGFVFPQFYGDYYGNNVVSLSDWGKLPLEGKYKSSDGIDMPSGEKLGGHLMSHGITTVDKFTSHLQKIEEHFWGTRFPVYAAWKRKWWKQYQEKGYFEMYTGFRCYGIMGRNDVVNYPVQGAAFHCLLWSFIRIDAIMRKEGWQTKLIGQIHDSMVFDVHPSELDHVIKTVRRVTEVELLEHWDWINAPLKVGVELCGVDQSWYYKEELKLD